MSLLNREEWVNGLSTHPDREFVSTLISYIDFGVPLLFEGPDLNQTFPNWKSCTDLRDAVYGSMLYDISRNWKVGPFETQPFPTFVGSPMGAFSKPPASTGVDKVRVIHDLSWPPEHSVNSYIPREVCSVQYVTIETAVAIVKSIGQGCLMGKIDLSNAYKQVGVRPADWHLLGSTWIDDSGDTVFYYDTVLPFGGRSSASLFNKFADGLEYIMCCNGVSSMIHYLDDMFTAGDPSTSQCLNNMNIMLDTCTRCGVEVNPSKTILPTTVIEFLGIIIDSVKMELRMSEARLLAIKTELRWWLGRRTGAKRSLLSLIGKLSFLSRIIQPGRTFLRRIITLSMRGKQLHHKMKLNSSARGDVTWWLHCVDNWNRKSVFLDDAWTPSPDFCLYTDASGVGIGGVFRNQWYSERLRPAERLRSIAWRELFAVVVACRIWGHLFIGRRMLFYCDNQSVVEIVNSGSSKCQLVMCLVRSLYYLAVRFNFDIKLRHVPGLDNKAADWLSRDAVSDFLEHYGDSYVRERSLVSRDF